MRYLRFLVSVSFSVILLFTGIAGSSISHIVLAAESMQDELDAKTDEGEGTGLELVEGSILEEPAPAYHSAAEERSFGGDSEEDLPEEERTEEELSEEELSEEVSGGDAYGHTSPENTSAGNAPEASLSTGRTAAEETIAEDSIAEEFSEELLEETGSKASRETVLGDTASGEAVSEGAISGETASGETPSGEEASEGAISGETASGEAESKETPSGEIVSEETLDEKAGSEIIVEEVVEKEIFIPSDDDGTAMDNDDCFAAYVNREMGLEGSLQAGTGDGHASEPARKSNFASTRLTGYNKIIYAHLIGKIRKVAAGELSSTVFTISLDELGLSEYAGKSWSAKDLGIDAVCETGSSGTAVLKDEAKDALLSFLKIDGTDLDELHRALLSDCPYDLYWYDKVKGVMRSIFTKYKSNDGTYKIGFTTEWKYSFKVSADYSADGKEKTFATNPDIGSSVRTARENALALVKKYEDKTDYEKLDGYRQEIIDRVSYNRAAVSSSTVPYGNPWQLIWTFDDDPETNIVCEGYSKSFQYLCDLTEWNSIFRECISVTGNLYGPNGGSSGTHMWNVVTLRDGKNYLVDLTLCENGQPGAGNGGRNLFLVGTGDTSVDKAFTTGNIADGYAFPGLNSRLNYYYDSETINTFGEEHLVLAPGKVTADTVAYGEYDGNHEHIFLAVGEVLPTCAAPGHGAGQQCAICGELDEDTAVYPAEEHTPGEWSIAADPTYEAEGEAQTTCNVCGAVMTKAVPKLVPVSEISLDAASMSLYKGESQALRAIVQPAEASDQSVIWHSEDETVATVTESGAVIAVGSGTAVITAKTNYGNGAFEASCEVTVKPLYMEDMEITLSGTSFVYDGSAITPAAAVFCEDLNRVLTAGQDYDISYAKNINVGTAQIVLTAREDSAYEGSVKKTFFITKAAQSLAASAKASSITAGQTTSISVSGAKGAKTFTSSNTAVAAVDESTGKVTAKKAGTAKITVKSAATANYKEASKTVVIKVLPPATSKLEAANLDEGIKITWAKVSGANGYDLCRDGKPIVSLNSGSLLSYTDTYAKTNGRTYTYSVIARASSGTSKYKKTVTVCRLSTPIVKSFKNNASGKLAFAWGKNSKAAGYQIQYSLSKAFPSKGTKTITIGKAGTTATTISGLTKGKVWYVRVRAYKTGTDAKKHYSAWKTVQSGKLK